MVVGRKGQPSCEAGGRVGTWRKVMLEPNCEWIGRSHKAGIRLDQNRLCPA